MSKVKLFKAKSENPNDFAEMGWDIMPPNAVGGRIVIYKWVKVDYDSELVKSLINAYNVGYKHYADMNLKYLAELDLKFINVYDDSAGEYKMVLDTESDGAKETLCNWRIQIDMDDPDRHMCLVPCDFTFPNPLYPCKWIGKYVNKAISKELEAGLIGTTYVEA